MDSFFEPVCVTAFQSSGWISATNVLNREEIWFQLNEHIVFRLAVDICKIKPNLISTLTQ